LPSGQQALTGLLTPVPPLSSTTNTGLPEADTTGMPRLTTEVTTLGDMTVRVGVSLPDSEAATGFGGAAAAAETLFGPGGPTLGSANGGPTADGGPLAVGQAFGNRYHIIRTLGVGGMGAVYQAFDAELGVAVAIKVIRPEIMADAHAAAEVERRFKRELLLARQVTHTNVVRIHDLGEINGIKYITMSYVEGTDLATVLKSEGRLPIPTVLRIVRQVASGLVAAHGAGVVHRDLKPANIMIAKDGEALIMDFGIAHSTDQAGAGSASVAGMAGIPSNLLRAARYEVTMQGAIVGTVEYMAPEQAKGRTVDQRADVYALGLILYDMLVGGRRAERADGAIEELQARMEHAPAPVKSAVPAIPAALDALVSRCLEPDPAARFQTSAEFLTELDRLDENGEPIPIKRVVRLPLAFAIGSLVVALSSGIWWYFRPAAPVVAHDPVTVLIADFENKTSDPMFDHTLEQTLRRALEGSGFISAYDSSRIKSAFGVQPPEKLDEAAARQVAMKQSVGVVLSGSVDRKGDGYEVSIKASQPITGKVTTTARERASSKDQVLATVTKLATAVRKVLGEKTSESNQLFAMRSISTTSFDVISEYAAGIEWQSKAKYEEARQRFLRAVELDPKFGLGYQSLAATSRNVGKMEDAEKYAKEALRYLDGMTERERFSTRGNYYRMTGDLQQCVKEYGELIARYAADTVAHNQRAICLVKLRDMRGAVAEMRKAIQILPNHKSYHGNLALFADYAGDFVTAEQEVRALKEPPAHAILALAYSHLGQGRLSEAAETYEKLRTMDDASGASGLGDLALYEGRFSDAVRIFEQASVADLKANNKDSAASKFVSLGFVHLAQGQKAAAAAAARKALENSRAMPFRFLAARILVEAGAIPAAKALAAELASQLGAEPQAYGKIIEGEIALKNGDHNQAIKILSDANSLVDTWLGHFDLGRAYLAATAYAQADSEFDRCITRRGEVLSLLDEDPTYGYFPPVYYYQGRAREGMGTAAFATSYREYLKIRGASTEDPLLPEVRKRAGA
jgi:eukaryotic-like serine/threonine-protein kinase